MRESVLADRVHTEWGGGGGGGDNKAQSWGPPVKMCPHKNLNLKVLCSCFWGLFTTGH